MRRRQSRVFRKRTTAMLKFNLSSADHLFSSSSVALKRYPPRRLFQSRMCLSGHTHVSPRPHGSCCTQIYCWQPSNPCCDHNRLESYFPTYVCINKSFIFVDECQWLLFAFLCSLTYTSPPNRVYLRQFRHYLQTFGLGPHPKTLTIFPVTN